MRGVAPLQAAVRKPQNSSEHLTTLHQEFLLLSLLAKCYKTGLSILEEDIFEVDQPRDLFLYCYDGWVVSAKTFQLLWLSFLGNSSWCHVHFNLLGSGKTTFLHRLVCQTQASNIRGYVMNLDPAVMTLPFGANIDIRHTVKYKEVMKLYNLGPNGGILTSLNLFAMKFDELGKATRGDGSSGMAVVVVWAVVVVAEARRNGEGYAAVFGAFVAGMACLFGNEFSAKLMASLAKCFEI
ncbi:hypothetical protein SO802_015143 [Lithocarpus litseifolius]|uniref:GPN-loop GTPase n=1 Tax=Lithocarpus litseifolius TaxID=425828 RepID=A0AAW2CTG5_9ROSI